MIESGEGVGLLDISTGVAVVAALVAALSAIFARWQARAAQRANEISLHESRLQIYKGLSRFRVHITAVGAGIKEEEVWKFSEIAELSEFYFSKAIHRRLEEIFQDSLKMLSMKEEWDARKMDDPVNAKSLAGQLHELMRQTRDECQRVTELIKQDTRVGLV